MKQRRGLWVSLVSGWLLTGCMASNCPIRSCHVRMEHQHGGRIYRGTTFGTMHSPTWWLSNRKGEGARASMASDRKGLKKEKGDGKKKKVKKQFRWERV
ncbi:hypothetical protein [Larkinella rosea]|uniref:Secreted protein n=1 Tax=Larkinella rosea TaxID=2025312 RepID=A0A3P1BI74_9BACT|nr:hypothetical protein [Larkinella rosea]RRB00771.1 hypothetical protein EHT25_21480 [Larkinella rosea]